MLAMLLCKHALHLLQILSNRQLSTTLAGSAAALAFLSWLSGRFGGYSGLLRADKASTMLERENSLLIDIRCAASLLKAAAYCPANSEQSQLRRLNIKWLYTSPGRKTSESCLERPTCGLEPAQGALHCPCRE